MLQKDLDRWYINGFSGIHNMMRKRALDLEEGPMSDNCLDYLKITSERLEKIIENLVVKEDTNYNRDESLVGLYHTLCDLLMHKKSMQNDNIQYLRQQLETMQKIIRGYEELNRRHDEQNQKRT